MGVGIDWLVVDIEVYTRHMAWPDKHPTDIWLCSNWQEAAAIEVLFWELPA